MYRGGHLGKNSVVGEEGFIPTGRTAPERRMRRRSIDMKLKPLGDRVLVKPAPKEEKTATGLYISSGAQEKPQRGEVIAVGAGKLNDKGERVAIDVKPGDQVYYGKFGGNEVKVDGEDFLLLRAEDIYAIIED
jgi:chaperonin GroES